MKLSEIKGERALEVLADLIEPVAEILGDKEIVAVLQSGKRVQYLNELPPANSRSRLEGGTWSPGMPRK